MKKGIHFLGHIVLGSAAIAGFSVIAMLLWNWLMPAIFGLACISFWQALGLLALARMLFGGMGDGRFWGMRMNHHRNPIREKWMRMTPEERKEFMKNHHAHRHAFGHDFFPEDNAGKQE
jgi:hypothetical protein